jgi:hypothetical protein
MVGPLVSASNANRGTSARHRRLGLLAALWIVAGCGPNIVSTATYQPGQTGAPASEGPTAPASAELPSLEPSFAPTAEPTAAPTAVPAVPPHLNPGFRYMDLLKVTVNKLAVRKQPLRSADLLHAYDIFHEPSPADLGAVRLNTGDYVSMHLGPVPVGDTTWYLVWGAEAGAFHTSDWYPEPPFDGSLSPGWVASNVAGKDYMTLDRHATMEEIDGFLPLGVNAAGFGSWESDPQPRHDGFLLDWAAAAPTQGTACKLTIRLVPEDPAAAPFVARSTISTSTVKVSTITGKAISAPWLPAPEGSWDEFRVVVDSTCNWALRLTPLHHD